MGLLPIALDAANSVGNSHFTRGPCSKGRGILLQSAWNFAPKGVELCSKGRGTLHERRGTLLQGRGTLLQGRGTLLQGGRRDDRCFGPLECNDFTVEMPRPPVRPLPPKIPYFYSTSQGRGTLLQRAWNFAPKGVELCSKARG
eukprot:gene25235-biopygen4487